MALVSSHALLIRPIYLLIQARDWQACPCHIDKAEVAEEWDSDGSTYRVEIEYSYEVNGVTYHSDMKNLFAKGSSSGRSGKQRAVKRYLSDPNRICYYNPKKPRQAVLNRGITASIALGLIPLVLFCISVLLFAHDFGFRRRSKTTAATTGRIILQPKTSPGKGVTVLLCINLFWNGILTVFICDVITSFRDGKPEWVECIFLIPFELIGLALFVGLIYGVLTLFNPRLTLSLSRSTVALG